MSNLQSKPFSNGTEYEIFKYDFCEDCIHHKLKEDGFPAFPEDGGCPIEDAMENARFDISLFPSENIRELTDANDGSIICWHYCNRFNCTDEKRQLAYFDLMKKALFKDKKKESEKELINKKLGNDFEQELCEIFSDAGFWVHNFANRKNGQPADIIAVKNGGAYLIDAKECTCEIFPLKRMEYNQELSMGLWVECGNTTPYFALKTRNEIYMVAYSTIMDLIRKGKKQLNFEDMNKYGTRLATWIRIRGI